MQFLILVSTHSDITGLVDHFLLFMILPYYLLRSSCARCMLFWHSFQEETFDIKLRVVLNREELLLYTEQIVFILGKIDYRYFQYFLI